MEKLKSTSLVIMEASPCPAPSLWTVGSRPRLRKSTVNLVSSKIRRRLIGYRRLRGTTAAVAESELVAAVEPAKVEITWQIIVGALAGVTPFVVAGVEFSKRIIAQRRCHECRGSGLVLRDSAYFRCPQCGGFLPWQSWRRFFTG